MIMQSIYIKRFVRPSVSAVSTFVCPPGDKQFVCPPGTNISHTQLGGDKQFVCPRGTKISHTQLGGVQTFFLQGGGQTFFYMGGGQTFSYDQDNVSEANILSSEARKPHAGARISGHVGP